VTIHRNYTCTSPVGFTARDAALIVKIVKESASIVAIEAKGATHNGGQLLDLLSMSVEHRDSVHVSAEGPDAYHVVEAVGAVFYKETTDKLASQAG